MKEIYLYFLLGALILSLALGDGEVRGNHRRVSHNRKLAVDGFEYESGVVSKSSKKSSKKTSKKSSSGKGGSRSSSSGDNGGDNGNSSGGKFESFYCLTFPVNFFSSHFESLF